MINSFLMKVLRQFSGGKQSFATNGTGTTGYLQENEVESLSLNYAQESTQGALWT